MEGNKPPWSRLPAAAPSSPSRSLANFDEGASAPDATVPPLRRVKVPLPPLRSASGNYGSPSSHVRLSSSLGRSDYKKLRAEMAAQAMQPEINSPSRLPNGRPGRVASTPAPNFLPSSFSFSSSKGEDDSPQIPKPVKAKHSFLQGQDRARNLSAGAGKEVWCDKIASKPHPICNLLAIGKGILLHRKTFKSFRKSITPSKKRRKWFDWYQLIKTLFHFHGH